MWPHCVTEGVTALCPARCTLIPLDSDAAAVPSPLARWMPLAGGTVFPLADTTDEQLRAWETGPYEMKYKQTRTCGPGLEVKPKKRKAVLWYNHHVSIETRFAGSASASVSHCGSPYPRLSFRSRRATA